MRRGLLVDELGPGVEVSATVEDYGGVVGVGLEEVEGWEALNVALGVRDVVLGGVEFSDDDVVAVEGGLELFVLGLGVLAVSAPWRVEEDEHVFALDFLLEIVRDEHDDIVFFALLRDFLGLGEALE